MKNKFTALVLAAVTVTGLLAVPMVASAERRASLEEGPIVRRKLLFRSSRFELAPRIGSTLNDAYKRNLMVGADANYHLTNHFSLGVGFGYGVLASNTDLLDQVNGSVDAEISNGLRYATTQILFDAHVSYVPLFGKISILDSSVLNYDLSLDLGFGGALITAVADGNAGGDDLLSGFKPAPVLGLGFRVFVSDSIAVNLAIKDYIYSVADVQEEGVEPNTELRNNVSIGLGASFFFPTDVKVSR
jgi:outer membrane beta-barrel protein